MLAQPLEDERGKCSPHFETTRHDYVDDDCGKCKVRKELKARREDLLGYLKRQDEGCDTTMHEQDRPSPILLAQEEEDFVLYRDGDEREDPAVTPALKTGNSLGTVEDLDSSGYQALRTISIGEIVYSQEEEDDWRRKRDSTPELDDKEPPVTGPPRKTRRPKWKTI